MKEANNSNYGHEPVGACDQKGGRSVMDHILEQLMISAANDPAVLETEADLFRGKHFRMMFNVGGNIEQVTCFKPEASDLEDFMAALCFDAEEGNDDAE